MCYTIQGKEAVRLFMCPMTERKAYHRVRDEVRRVSVQQCRSLEQHTYQLVQARGAPLRTPRGMVFRGDASYYVCQRCGDGHICSMSTCVFTRTVEHDRAVCTLTGVEVGESHYGVSHGMGEFTNLNKTRARAPRAGITPEKIIGYVRKFFRACEHTPSEETVRAVVALTENIISGLKAKDRRKLDASRALSYNTPLSTVIHVAIVMLADGVIGTHSEDSSLKRAPGGGVYLVEPIEELEEFGDRAYDGTAVSAGVNNRPTYWKKACRSVIIRKYLISGGT